VLLAQAQFTRQGSQVEEESQCVRKLMTNSFSGIRPLDLPGFIMAELGGALAALALMSWLLSPSAEGRVSAKEVEA